MVNSGGPALKASSLLTRLLGRLELSFIGLRYLAALLQATEALLLAGKLGPQDYGRFALWVQIGSLLTLTGIGSAWGFLLSTYRRKTLSLRAAYILGASAQYALGGTFVLILLTCFRSDWKLSAIYFFALVPQMVLETPMRVSGRYNRFALFRCIAPTLSISLVLLGAIDHLATAAGLSRLTAAVLISGLCYHLANLALLPEVIDLASRAVKTKFALWPKTIAHLFNRYSRRILPLGLGAGAASIPSLLSNNLDRFFIEKYRSGEALGNYSLAWLLVQGGTLALGSLNLLVTVRIGTAMKHDRPDYHHQVRRQVWLTTAVAGLIFLGLLFLSTALRLVYRNDYADLPWITCILAVGQLPFGIASVFLSASFFSGRAKAVNLILWGTVVAVAASNIVCAHLAKTYEMGVIATALLLFTSNLFLIVWILRAETVAPLSRPTT